MKRPLFFTLILAVAFVLLIALSVQFVFGAPSARERLAAPAVPRGLGMTIVVTTTADSGHGSLRWALETAEASDLIDNIAFNPWVFPPTNPMTIALSSGLSLTQGDLLIDASNAGVVLEGSGAPADHDGIFITSNGNMVKGLQILHFGGDGVVIKDGAQNNTIGGDRAVGAGPTGEGNVISGNGHGVRIEGSGTMSNTVSGNLIGLDLDGTQDVQVQDMAISPNYASDQTLFIATRFHGVWQTTDGGDTWAMVSNGLTISDVLSLAISPNYGADGTVFAGTAGAGIFKSTDWGSSWTSVVEGGLTSAHVQALVISPDYANDSTIFAAHWDGVVASTDGGSNWEVTGLSPYLYVPALAISPDFAADGTLFVGTHDGRVFRSTDRGFGWTDVSGSWTQTGVNALVISPNYASDQTIFAAIGAEVFKSAGGGDDWNSVGGDPGWCGNIDALAISPNYAVDQTLFAGDGCSGSYRSTNGGTNWAQTLTGDRHSTIAVSPAYASDQTLFVGTYADGVLKSVDGGSTWIEASGLTERGNHQNGVSISDGAQWNTIGGDTAGERNVISNNSHNGVSISGSGTMSNTVSGNYIGTDATGSAPLGNGMKGIVIGTSAQQNVIGGTTAGERNVIGANGNEGVGIGDTGTVNNTVSGNFIGSDASGTLALPNGRGITIWGGASYNLIGGSNATPGGACSGACNLISGNSGCGVSISDSDTMSNTVSGNYVGTDVSGTTDLGNVGGVYVRNGPQYNTIGGTTSGERNLISGNGGGGPPPPRLGVSIRNADHNTVIGNYIGTDVTGSVSLPNKPGVSIEGHYNHVVQNLVSGNAWGGIGVGGTGNTVSSNIIGTNVTGMTALGNEGEGIGIGDEASYNLIGGSNGTPSGACSGECNLISGNNGSGVGIGGSGTMSNTVSGNYIGTNISGTTVISNAEDGVHISEGARYNLIGGVHGLPGERNLISGNGYNGVFINSSGTMSNTVSGNYIGTDASGGGALGNGYCGVYVGGGAQQNTVGPSDTVAYNDGIGVIIAGTSTLSNTITQNSIHSNAGLGIDNVDGGNTELPPPVIAQLTGGDTVSGTACPNCTVEVFSDHDDEGRWFHGSTTADATGHFTFTATTPFTGTYITATATDADGNTSEFPPPPSISHIAPNQGTNDVPNEINVYGLNFAEGVSVTLGTTPPTDLNTVRYSPSHLRATVPVSLSAGTYNLTVANPDGRSDTLANAYTVFDVQVENDDLYAQSHDLWSDPLTIRQGEQANLGLVVHRQGGKTTLFSVTVRFYDGDPDNGGTPIGHGTVYLLSPRSSESTAKVPWSPATAGDYAIYARIDPDSAISETIETNNTVSTTITVLPMAGDTTPPVVTSFAINSGAEMTAVPTVTLSVGVEDNVAGSGMGSIFFVEFEFVQAAMQWVPVQASGWLSYTDTHTWTLTPVAGARYLQAWAADKAGNISLAPYKDHISYLPPSDQIAAGQVRVYRQYVAAGQTLSVTVTPISGDPDLYIWSPSGNLTGSSLNLAGEVDQWSDEITETGTYQIEVYGYNAAKYAISIEVIGTKVRSAARERSIRSVNLDKTPRTEPVVAVSNEPPGQMAVPSAPVTGDSRAIYLPLVVRSAANSQDRPAGRYRR